MPPDYEPFSGYEGIVAYAKFWVNSHLGGALDLFDEYVWYWRDEEDIQSILVDVATFFAPIGIKPGYQFRNSEECGYVIVVPSRVQEAIIFDMSEVEGISDEGIPDPPYWDEHIHLAHTMVQIASDLLTGDMTVEGAYNLLECPKTVRGQDAKVVEGGTHHMNPRPGPNVPISLYTSQYPSARIDADVVRKAYEIECGDPLDEVHRENLIKFAQSWINRKLGAWYEVMASDGLNPAVQNYCTQWLFSGQAREHLCDPNIAAFYITTPTNFMFGFQMYQGVDYIVVHQNTHQ